jgi:hypothetical protein
VPTYVVDTNLYIEAITTDDGNAALASFQRRCVPFLFQHSTIAHEILAGARDEADYREYHEDWVAPFEDLQPDSTRGRPSASMKTDRARLIRRGRRQSSTPLPVSPASRRAHLQRLLPSESAAVSGFSANVRSGK